MFINPTRSRSTKDKRVRVGISARLSCVVYAGHAALIGGQARTSGLRIITRAISSLSVHPSIMGYLNGKCTILGHRHCLAGIVLQTATEDLIEHVYCSLHSMPR